MSSSRYADVARIFREVMDLAPGARGSALDSACGSDFELRREVEALLAHDESPHGILDNAGVVAAAIGDGAGLDVHGLIGAEGVLPTHIGRYRVLELLGEGGMGSVFLAEQDTPRRTVALKVIRAAFVLPSARRRFERETRALARLQHPGIAQIHDAGTAQTERGTCPFIAMEYVRGRPFIEHIAARRLDVPARIRLLIEVCLAVQHAHDQGIVHRDIKASNVLVTEEGRPKLLDFGIARVEADDGPGVTLETRPGQIIGTLPSMAPEQFASPPVVNERSDIYALGVLLFEALTGELPHRLDGLPIAEAVRVKCEREPRRLASVDRSLRGDLDTIVAHCLERDPSRRYASALDLARDLERHLEDQPIAARRASAWYQLAKYARRNRAVVTLLLLVAVTLVLATALSVTWSIRAEEALKKADAAHQETLRQAAVAERRAYIANINAAGAGLEAGNVIAASQLLDAIDPALRGTWEYRHFASRLDGSQSIWRNELSPVLALAPAGEGDRVFAVTWDRKIATIEPDTGPGPDEGTTPRPERLVRTIAPIEARGTATAACVERGWVFVGCYDGHVRMVRLSDDRLIDAGKLVEHPVHEAELSRDGTTLVLGDGEQVIRVYSVDWKGETPAFTLRDEFKGRAATIHPDGTLVAYGLERRIEWRRLADGAILARTEQLPAAAWSIDFSPDGRDCAAGFDDRTMRVWTAPDAAAPPSDRSPTLTWMDEMRTAVKRVAFSPSGRRIAAGLWNGMIVVLDRASGTLRVENGHAELIEDLLWLPAASVANEDGADPDLLDETLVSASQDRTVRRWLGTRSPVDHVLPRQRAGVGDATLSPDGSRAFILCRDGTLRIADVDRERVVDELTATPAFRGHVVLDPTSDESGRHAYLVQQGGMIGTWDLVERRMIRNRALDAERIDVLAVNDAGTLLAAGLSDGRVLVLDAATLDPIREIARYPLAVRGIAFVGPEGKDVLSAAANGGVILSPVDGSEPMVLGNVGAAATAVAVSADGTRGYVSSTTKILRGWTLQGPERGKAMFSTTGTDVLLCAILTPDGTRIICGVQGGRLGIWDAFSGENLLILTPHDRSVESMSFDRSGRRLISAASTGIVTVSDQWSAASPASPLRTRTDDKGSGF